jgi:hypothetical protein
MKKILGLLVVILAISITASVVFARNLPAITAANKLSYKNMLKEYLSPVNHGYGIGFNDNSYVTAKWYITSVRTLNMSKINEIVKNSNATDWSQLREQVQNSLKSQGMNVTKGRINIGKNMYILTDINVSNNTVAANIREMPIYSNCKDQNITAEQCEIIATQIGSLSLTKKTSAIETQANEPKVWAGTLNFNSTAYTFVTFAYPR